MATESIREDAETNTAPPAPPAPWESVEFPQHDELTPYERRRVEESKSDTAMRREAVAAQQGTSTIDHQMRARPRVVVPLDENTIYQFTVSPSLHEDRVFALAPDEHDDVRGYLKDATDFLRSTRTTLEKIDTAYRGLMLDKSLNADARSLKLEAEASKAFVTAFTRYGAAVEGLTKKIEYTEGELSKPLEAQAATARSLELREVLREMKSAERNELIRAAIHAEKPSAAQREILQAVLGSNHITVGISEVEQAAHTRKYNERIQPQLQRRLDLMKKSLAVVASINPATIRSQFEGSMRSKFTRATAIRGISDKAQAALNAINARE